MTTQKSNNSFLPIFIIGVLFFIFGFITWLNATLIDYLKIACELTTFEASLVTFAFYISYFVMALPSSLILDKIGFKNGMTLGLVVMAIGALIFIPAANTRYYGLFLTGLFVQGLGLAILQTASNPYVTILGPIESAAKRISVMGIANKAAGILSPIVLAKIVLEGADELKVNLLTMDAVTKAAELDALSAKVIMPYVIMAIVLIILGIAIKYSGLPDIDEKDENSEGLFNKVKGALSHPYLRLGFLAIFFYLPVEIIPVDFMGQYGSYLGFETSFTQYLASFTLVTMLLGYVFGVVAIPKYISQEKALVSFTILGIVLTILATILPGIASIILIGLLGFANSLMWPAIWPLAIDGLGKYTKTGSAILIMGIIGGALLSPLFIKVSELIGNMQLAYLMLIPCYLYILYYGVKGSKVGR